MRDAVNQRRMGRLSQRVRKARIGALLCVAVILFGAQAHAQTATPLAGSRLVDSVNTFIGSKDEGNTFPGASMPFGMVQVSPIGTHYAGWRYDDQKIRGFGHFFLSGAGCWEQGGQVVGAAGDRRDRPGGVRYDRSEDFDHKQYAARYTHDGEIGQARLLQGAADRLRRHRRRGHRAHPRRRPSATPSRRIQDRARAGQRRPGQRQGTG